MIKESINKITSEGSSFFGKKILLVEDNDMNIMLISLLLKKLYIDFDVAKDGEIALDFFNKNKYDLILTDINVPKLTGNELAAIIRKDTNSAKAQTPIIAVTASIVADDIEHYLSCGINEVLFKPFKEAGFNAVLHKYLG